MKSSIFFFLWAIVSTGYAQTWTPTSSSIGFTAKMMGLEVDGSLKGMKTNFKIVNNEPSFLSATVESQTIVTGNSLRDKHLREKSDFFQVTIYPTISMSSVSISKISENNYTGVFKLTIKDKSKNIKVPFTFQPQKNKAVLKSAFVINRKDWDLGGNPLGLSETIKVNLLVNLDSK